MGSKGGGRRKIKLMAVGWKKVSTGLEFQGKEIRLFSEENKQFNLPGLLRLFHL